MQSEFSFRINGKAYEVVEVSRDMTLGNFLEKNAVSFSNNIERQGVEGVILFLCDHNCFAEPCHYFLDPFRTELIILADRDLVAVDFLGQEYSEHQGAESYTPAKRLYTMCDREAGQVHSYPVQIA